MPRVLYNLSNPQKSILLTEQFYQNTNVNNICGTAIISDSLDFDILKKAINLVIKNNNSFRIRFAKQGNELKQYIHDFSKLDLEIVTVCNKQDLDSLEFTSSQKRFNIFEENLFEFKLFKFENNTGGFFLNIHHFIADGWSLGLTCRKVINTYVGLLNGTDIICDDDLSYIKYLENEKEYMDSSKFSKDKEYWDSIFKTTPDIVTLPSEMSNSNSNLSCVGENSSFLINKRKMKLISDFCNQNKISVFNFFMSVYSIYIHRVTNSRDFIIGTPILNRTNFKEKNTTGMFSNIMPLRLVLSHNTSFLDFSREVATNIVSLFRHQKYPYQNILENIRKNDNSIPNLYNIMFSYQITHTNSESNLKYDTRWAFNGCCADDLDIQLYDLDQEGSLNILYVYKKLKYSTKYITAMHYRVMEIIDQILENNNIRIDDISIVTKTEENLLLNEFNNTGFNYDKNKTVIDLFEKQVKQNPLKPAIIFEDTKLTYKELNEKANLLAHYLISKNVKPHDIVGIMINRSIEMAIGLLAILKVGAAYLPIDPEYPSSRIGYMLEDSNSKLVLTNKKNYHMIKSNIEKIDIGLNTDIYINNNIQNLDIKSKPDDLIYLIYTSGSTGKPKGVMLKHINIHNFLVGLKNIIDFNPEKTMVSVTTICFDIFVLEFWGGLTSGIPVVIANETEQNNPQKLNELCLKNNVNMIQTTPSRFLMLLEDVENIKFIKNMSDIMIGGESFSKVLLEKLLSTTKSNIFNMYGPTETAVWSTIKKLPSKEDITVGKPIANTRCYILDKNKKLLPQYIPGELYIGGDGVSNGYLNREDLTNEKFIVSPFNKKDVIYNTNDLAYFNDKGEIIHLGRTDFQVKIRGYRIELEEIENKIMSIPEITKAIVVSDKDCKYLICYYTSKIAVNSSEISSYLLGHLPNYMVPSYFHKLEDIPLTPNGKLDRKRLPEIKITSIFEKCTTKTEKLLHGIISKLLKVDELDINSPFMSLGLDSLDIINIQTMLISHNLVLNTQDFYKYNTIKTLSEHIDNNIYIFKEKDAQIPIQFRHKFDDILSKIELKTNKDDILGNVFLTGANGFIGVHILHELLENTAVKIYCLVRGNSVLDSSERLLSRYSFYFKKDIQKLINDRIIILNGNISKENIGLSNQNLNSIVDNISTVIHTAAIVKHYGNFEQFQNINIEGTKNISEFALKHKKRLIHISSVSVSGNYLVKQDNRNIDFTENNLYIGQKYTNNVYVHSKFESERLVLSYMEKGLTAQIHRIGILSGRYNDGVFQENIADNAFYNRIKSIINLSFISKSMLEQEIEFSPVDICTKAIVALAKNSITDNRVFHLYNHHFAKIKDVIRLLKNFGININIVSDNEFEELIVNISKNPDMRTLGGIINDLSQDSNHSISINYNFSVNIKSDYTKKYLHLLKSEWPQSNDKYILKLLNYMRNVDFI